MLSPCLPRYGADLCHALYNSREVGQRAADSIAASFSSPFLGDSSLPKLTCGRMVTTALPGGGRFSHACAPGMQVQGGLESQVGHQACLRQEMLLDAVQQATYDSSFVQKPWKK